MKGNTMSDTKTECEHMIRLTDGRGVTVEEDTSEPNVDSIVLVRGIHGLALQRHAIDGLWHCSGKTRRARTWSEIIVDRDVFLVYEAPPRQP